MGLYSRERKENVQVNGVEVIKYIREIEKLAWKGSVMSGNRVEDRHCSLSKEDPTGHT